MSFIGKNPKLNTLTHTAQSADPTTTATGMSHYSDGTVREKGLWVYDGSAWVLASEDFSEIDLLLKNISISNSVASSALTITVAGGGGTALSASNPLRCAIRHATLATGQFVSRTATSNLTAVISSGSTLGHQDAKESPIYVYLLDNAGTLEIAYSSSYHDEKKLHSTTAEGGAGAADSYTVLYSTTARSNVSIRLIGVMYSTQTTAGTWAAVATQIAICGGESKYLRSEVVVDTSSANGSTGVRVKCFTNTQINIGSDITYTSDATNGDYFTINRDGLYSISFTGAATGLDAIGISLNGASTTGLTSLAVGARIAFTIVTATYFSNASATRFLKAGDVIRPHQDGSTSGTAANSMFSICSVD